MVWLTALTATPTNTHAVFHGLKCRHVSVIVCGVTIAWTSLSPQRLGDFDTCCKMAGSRRDYAKWNNLEKDNYCVMHLISSTYSMDLWCWADKSELGSSFALKFQGVSEGFVVGPSRVTVLFLFQITMSCFFCPVITEASSSRNQ